MSASGNPTATAPTLPRVRIIDPPVALPSGIALPGLSQTGRREVRIPLWLDRDFRSLWMLHKLRWLERGFTIRQHNGAWWLQQFLTGGPGAWTLTAVGAAKLAALLQPVVTRPAMELPAEFVLPELPYGLEGKLFEYQRQPARQLFRALTQGREEWGYPGAWDCSDLGTGKTYQALAAALATGLEVGVVCPKSVISGWRGAFKHFGQSPAFVLNYESLRTGKSEWLTRQRGSHRPFEWRCDPDDVLLIWDEAHNLKNPSLNRSMAFAALRQGFRMICVSGTMAAKPTNLAATGAVVGLHRGNTETYEKFLKAHNCYQVGGGQWAFDAWKQQSAAALQRIHHAVFPQRGARVRIADLGDRFPETQILSEGVETKETAAIAAAYEAAEEIVAIMRRQGAAEIAILGAQRAAYMKARTMSELAKVEAMAARALEEIEAGRSVAVFLNFTESRERMQAALNTKCAIFGGQDGRQRDECIRQFQADESRVIVVMSAAGGTGVSLHDVRGEFPRTALICPDNNAVTLGQVLGRVHRAGGKSRSRQIILFAAGTVEEGICDNVRRKLASIDTVNDGNPNPEDKF